MKILLVLFLSLFTISGLRANQKDSLNSHVPKFFISLSASGIHSNTEIGFSKLANTTLNILPFIGYRIDRFVFGFGFSNSYIIKNTEEFDYTNGFETQSERGKEFSLMPTIKYYSKFNLVIAVSYLYGKGFGDLKFPLYFNYGNYNVHTRSKSEIIGAAATIGYAIKAGKSFLIEPQLSFYNTTINTDYISKAEPTGYNYYYQTNPYTNKYSGKEKRKDFLLGIGITYRF